MNPNVVFHIPGTLYAFDLAYQVNGQWVALTYDKTLDQLSALVPGIEVVSDPGLLLESESAVITAPQRIKREEYSRMLEMLPPRGHVVDAGCESFKFIEHQCDRITAIFAIVDGVAWKFFDRYTLKHREIIERIKGVC